MNKTLVAAFGFVVGGIMMLTACSRGPSTPLPHTSDRSPAVVNIDANPWASLDSKNEYRLEFTDGRSLAFTKSARIKSDGKYVSFRGHGYQVSYPVRSISRFVRVANGARRPLSSFDQLACDGWNGCCDFGFSCLTTDPPPDPRDIVTIDFRNYGGSEICDWDPMTDWVDCSNGGNYARPNTGDGYKGNVVKSFTWSVTRQEAELVCNPASFMNHTKGTIEYTEARPYPQLPVFTVRETGDVEPNTEVHMHFHPALSASSQAAGVFLFVYPSIGLAANCSAAPPATVP